MGVDGRSGGGPARQLLGLAEKQAGVEIGRYTKYNTRLSVNLPYTSRTHTDTPTHLRVAQWAHLCGLGAVASTARPVSGVECKWSGHPCCLYVCPSHASISKNCALELWLA